MRISFRQGIVQAPSAFLVANGSTVNLSIASPEKLLYSIADGTTNYLFTETESVISAWAGPFSGGTDYWLYWDINTITGVRTFGHTLLSPVAGNTAPGSPANDQHWFDTTNFKMKVWNSTAGRWVNKTRVFAGQYQSGSSFISISASAPAYTGTQVGLTGTSIDVGALMYDENGDPVKRGNGTFFTTADVVTASIASAAQVKLDTIIIEAVATSNIPAYSIVTFSGFRQVQLATNFLMDEGAYGMIETDATIGDVVHVVLGGLLTNPAWDWTAQGVNTPLYVNTTGALTASVPPNPTIVATVVDTNTILIRPSIQTITFDGVTSPATDTTLGTVKLSVASATPAQPVVVETSDPRLSTGYEEAVASGGQTVFNTTVDTVAAAANVAHLQVFVNGTFQQEGATKAYTVTGANQITFNSGLSLNDDVVIFTF